MSGSSAQRRPLEDLGPFLIAANVRGAVEVSRYSVGPGLGRDGDLVVGCVMVEPGQHIVILDQNRIAHKIAKPQRVVAVLGPRDSSTHVCAVIPSGGLAVDVGTALHWVAGESGIVGRLEREPPTDSIYAAEVGIDFHCDGLVLNADGRPVNIREFTVTPPDRRLNTPIVLIAATSSESGKTVLAGEIIRRLSDAGKKVGAIKVTGTGGVLDSLHHERSGATAVLDQVDAGMITTNVDVGEFNQRIPLVFRQMESLGVDLIVAELGGDLLSANNLEVFRIDELMDNAMLLIVICNDALAAAGVDVINDTRLGYPKNRLRHCSSPFRNHAGMSRRMATAGISDCYDPRAPEDLARLVDQIRDMLPPGVA